MERQVLRTERLTLDPLQVADAADMVKILSDASLYSFTGGQPPSLAELEVRYRSQVAGSPDETERWHNWILRLTSTRQAIGFVQATVIGEVADVAWVIGVLWQRGGFAAEAAVEMCSWLVGDGVQGFTAHIHPKHVASQRVAARIGLAPTDELDEDGEVVWVLSPQSVPD